MAIDKALYAAPMGLEAIAAEQEPLEIEIENPDSITIDGLEIDFEPEEEGADKFDANLAEYIDQGELAQICNDLIGDV